MKKALRGGYTCCVPGCSSNTKRDKELSFHKLPRDVSLREKWVNSIKRKDFIPGEQHRVCSLHFHGAPKQGRSDVPIIFPLLPQAKQRKPPQVRLPLEPPVKRGENGTSRIRGFLCGLVGSNEKERTDMKEENATHEVRDKYVKIWSLTFDIQFYTGFPSYSTLNYFFTFCHSIELLELR